MAKEAFIFEEADEERLYRAMVRQSAYGEAVKNHNVSLFEKRADRYADQMAEAFKGFKGSADLDSLTRREFNALMSRFDRIHRDAYSKIIADAKFDLQDVMKYQRRGTQIIDAAILDRIDMRKKRDMPTVAQAQARIRAETRRTGLKAVYGNGLAFGDDDAKLWATISAEYNPASGLTIDDQFDQLSQQMRQRMQRMARQARANNWTIDEMKAALIGEGSPLGDVSVLRHIQTSYRSTYNTAHQMVAQETNAAINSAILPYFQWVSILDNSTTHICQDRADRIYRYDKDPRPPAHYNCRSTVFPRSSTEGGRMDESESFSDWIEDQPRQIQDDLLTPSVARELNGGKLSDARRRKLEILARLYPQALEEKTGLML